MNDTPNTNGKDKNAPDFVLRDGNLRSAVWREEGEYGPMFNTRITKLYRDEDGQPKETTTLSAKDLLRVSELARETHHEVLGRQRDHALERKTEKQVDTNQNGEFFDDEMSRSEIQRERFKEQRSQGARRSKPRERKAR